MKLDDQRAGEPESDAARHLASTGVRADAFVHEALRWLPDTAIPRRGTGETAPPSVASPRRRILLVDDNADLRDYVRRLLEPNYELDVVGDGVAALESARARPPDMIISDVMMLGGRTECFLRMATEFIPALDGVIDDYVRKDLCGRCACR